MGSKNISITEEAYNRLKAHKRDDESFTDVIVRLTDDERDVMSGFGAWSDTDKGDHAREAREQLNADLEDGR